MDIFVIHRHSVLPIHNGRAFHSFVVGYKLLFLLPRPEGQHDARTGGADLFPNQLLELRPVWSRAILDLSEDLRLVGQLVISPLTVEIEPVNRVALVIRSKSLGCCIIAISICALDGVPQYTLVGIVDDETFGQVKAGNGVVMLSE